MSSYVQNKVFSWVGEKLSEIAITQPQAAYTAFTHVFLHLWSYIARTVPMSPGLFHPLNEVLSLRFVPAVTGQPAFGSTDRELLSLPAHHGGLDTPLPF